jgi:hypothetical protein
MPDELGRMLEVPIDRNPRVVAAVTAGKDYDSNLIVQAVWGGAPSFQERERSCDVEETPATGS